ncbi:family 20 glycosylhydrolase [Cellulophaga sp. F20128]|uniref:beta-N-acetylhexosaminidase n=1 Tax=Cellulophaga sp. F20128 TaxID=2926413 RepID=UPI001FF5F1E0|nr:family 20 glycosylhydrolase [Cellulophaga sp. F20128]MCK0156435.1 family 20 glycosylhydrolase [Cellulophaga sp. F20128]
MKNFINLIVLVALVLLASCDQKTKKIFTEADLSVIPKPVAMKLTDGTFQFTGKTKLVAHSDQQQTAQSFSEDFAKVSGFTMEVSDKLPAKNFLQFVVDDTLEDEGYTLVVKGSEIIISAKGRNGFVYALETIKQLLPATFEGSVLVEDEEWVIPNVEVSDAPRFKWRGLMLDVSRHFFDTAYIKRTIDRMAMLKMNTLHWHLVDDQGWRIEIKKYPKLTEVGGFRVDQEDKSWNTRPNAALGTEATYGGFYTQEEIKEVVAYATARGITVVPEIEMPAHVSSAVAAYPILSCLENEIMVPSGGVWPITDIYCPGKETTFTFLEDVLTEVMALFPSKYIHVGGDEATKTNWKTCDHCQARIQSENLESVEELQSYFIKRMERFISSNDRILIGWDEILEGGLAPGATVMSWRGVKGGLEASAEGHDVVMTPGSHCYFDHYQGDQDQEPLAWGGYLPLSKVYQFDPVVEGMTPAQEKHVLGGQANLWAEYIPTTQQSEYMIFPRLAAMSEAVWSPKESKDWTDFSKRVKGLFKRYDVMGINYAKSAYQITANTEIDLAKGSLLVTLKNEFPGSDIRYSLDGSDLDTTSIKYTAPFQISSSTSIKAAMFEDNKLLGPVLAKYINYHKAAGKKVSYKEQYHKSYQGAKEVGMVNVLRGSKHFHDGQWQAWLGNNMEVVIDMENDTEISKISVGAMEAQGSGIYFPTKVEAFVSKDGKKYTSVGAITRAYVSNGDTELKDFEISFEASQNRYVKVIATNLGSAPNGGGSWLFVDEIVVE